MSTSQVFRRFKHSNAPLRTIEKVQFGVLGEHEIRKMSVCEIETFQTTDNGIPVRGGLSDPRLGSMDRHAEENPGMFGHIELASPVYHVGFFADVYKLAQCICLNCSRLLVDKSSEVYKTTLSRTQGKARLDAILKLSSSVSACVHPKKRTPKDLEPAPTDGTGEEKTKESDKCGAPKPKFNREGLEIRLDYSGKDKDNRELSNFSTEDRKAKLTAEKLYTIFSRVSDEDCAILGLNPVHARPEWLLVKVLPVPPPHVRPSIEFDASTRSEDDLTHKYAEILKANAALKNDKARSAPPITLEKHLQVLQYHVATLMDNSLPPLPTATQRSGKSMKSIRERLVGKAGRVRGNLMGKRVDFSARTVITADSTLSIHQVGVPRSIAANLTVPEMVTRFNIEKLQRLVKRGPGVENHPGAKYIIRDDGTVKDLEFLESVNDVTLKEGYIVERHLMDDDVVLFNRQPSLHKMSIMCHKAKILDYSTFRMNLTCTPPYNADFDGDEMNLHALQTLPAIAEAQELMIVPRLIVSPQSNRPVMSIVQDSLLGAQKMSKRDVFITRDLLYNMLMWLDDWDGKIPTPAIMLPARRGEKKHRAIWTGKQVFSMMLPNINVRKKLSGSPDNETKEMTYPYDTQVIIKKGELLAGILDKATLGKGDGGIIHVIMNDIGSDATRDFINSLQKVVNYWLLQQGFTVGIRDTEAPADVMKDIRTVISNAANKVQNTVRRAQQGTLKLLPGQSIQKTFETTVNEVLNDARSEAGKLANKALDETNNIVATVVSGSKGNFINISQIIACVGQQAVEGKRIPFGFKRRTLPHYCKDDLGPESRGFVANSYLKGLTPSEFFFHMMGGREGLIDTAVKTAETGYIQRRLVKALEDVSVRYDGSVRNNQGKVLQFLYGEDGIDGRWIQQQSIINFGLPRPQFLDKFSWGNPHAPDFGRNPRRPELFLLDPKIIEFLRTDASAQEILEREVQQLAADREVLYDVLKAVEKVEKFPKIPLPLHLDRMILNIKTEFGLTDRTTSDLSPVYVVKQLKALMNRLIVVPGDDRLSMEAQENATLLMGIQLRAYLASKVAIMEHHLTRDAFDLLLDHIYEKFMGAKVAAGEMCGVLAAQSIGEPTTQMTLNTFHFAGVSAKNVTLGVPRLKELINVAKSVATPSLTIWMRDRGVLSENEIQELQQQLEYTTLRDVIQYTEIHYDPLIVDEQTAIPADAERGFVQLGVQTLIGRSLISDASVLSKWTLRIVLSASELNNRGIDLDFIQDKLEEKYEKFLVAYHSGGLDEMPTFHVRVNHESGSHAELSQAGDGMDEDADFNALRDAESEIVGDLKLQGVDNITKLYHSVKDDIHWTHEEGIPSKPRQVTKLETDGSNLSGIFGVHSIDYRLVRSNDIVETFEVLGIEACRRALLDEIRAVISFDNSYVNYRHLSMLIDVMTFRGALTAITRHGINRVDTGPLQKCSFEETVEILLQAAVYGERDEVAGVTENIMLGQLAPCGTGHFALVLDEAKLKHAIFSAPLPGMDPLMEMGDARATPLMAVTPGMGTPLSTIANSPLPVQSGSIEFSPDVYSKQGTLSPASGINAGGITPYASSPSYGRSPAYAIGQGAGGGTPMYSPSSPAHSPTFTAGRHGAPGSPAYNPSPAYGGGDGSYSPTSPAYSPTSPGLHAGEGSYSPTSPAYSPTSPAYSPTSPAFSPQGAAAGGGSYSPTSPAYSPTSPAYSPTSPAFSPQNAGSYSPTSPAYSPTSPAYSPTSPKYSPQGGSYSPTSPMQSPQSPAYSPASPNYSPKDGSGGASKPK